MGKIEKKLSYEIATDKAKEYCEEKGLSVEKLLQLDKQWEKAFNETSNYEIVYFTHNNGYFSKGQGLYNDLKSIPHVALSVELHKDGEFKILAAKYTNKYLSAEPCKSLLRQVPA